MATSLMCVNLPSILSPISTETCQNREKMVTGFGLSKTSFLCGNTKKLFSSQSKRIPRFSKFKSLIAASSFNHIPKQFREENLKEGLMENYKNVPEQFYGLSPSQMDMFATKDSPIFQQSAKLKEESLTSARSYSNSFGMWSMSGMKDGGQSTNCSMNFSMNHGGYRRARRGPPDLASLLLDARVIYLGLPMYDAVSELILAEFVYLQFDDPNKPIYLYINCTGTKNEENQIIGDCVNAYGIADAMDNSKCKVYTLNVGKAYGQAAMLLSLGEKGYRFLQPNSSVSLYLPSRHRMNGTTTNMYYEAKDLEAETNTYLKLLSKGIGKPEEELRQDLGLKSKYFMAEDAIEYGIADKLITSEKLFFEDDANWASKTKRTPRRGGEANPLGSSR